MPTPSSCMTSTSSLSPSGTVIFTSAAPASHALATSSVSATSADCTIEPKVRTRKSCSNKQPCNGAEDSGVPFFLGITAVIVSPPSQLGIFICNLTSQATANQS